MKIMVVWPAARFSIWDVASGFRKALAKRLGEENVLDYYFDTRVAYHMKALPEEHRHDIPLVSKLASETILPEAVYANVDAVLFFSGLSMNPAAPWLLNRVGIPSAVVFMESPYEDVEQEGWISIAPYTQCLTNERTSAQQYGWTYLPHSFDPEVHQHTDPEDFSADVLLVGSGWPERIAFFESIDWTGINLKIFGIWPELREGSPLKPFYTEGLIDNKKIAKLYSGTKICLNFHRQSLTAESLGPRAYEIAGCGAFQLSDPRKEIVEVFGNSVPTFRDAKDLESKIHYFLGHEFERRSLAAASRRSVANCTFDHRVSIVLDTLQRTQSMKETA